MEVLNNSLREIQSLGSSLLTNTTENPVLYGILAMFLAMYGPRLHPRLPTVIRNLFNNNMFRFVVILLVIYMSNNNLQMALIVAIGFLLVTSIATSLDIDEHFARTKEGYADYDAINEFYEEEFTDGNGDKSATNPDEDEDEEESEEVDGLENDETIDQDEDEEEKEIEEDTEDHIKKSLSKASELVSDILEKGSSSEAAKEVEPMINKLASYMNDNAVESFQNYAPF